MLIVKTFVNEEEIDEIKIQRIEDFKGEHSFHNYKIIKPEGYEDIPLSHKYSDGYMALLLKALNGIRYIGWLT